MDGGLQPAGEEELPRRVIHPGYARNETHLCCCSRCLVSLIGRESTRSREWAYTISIATRDKNRAHLLVPWSWHLRIFFVRWLVVISTVAFGQPAVPRLVLHVQVAVLDNDQVHILKDANCHEDEAVSHQLANNAILLRCGLEGHQNRISVHHGEERIGSVTEVAEKIPIVPKDGQGEQAVSDEDRHDACHDLDIEGDSDAERPHDHAVVLVAHEVLHDCDPVERGAHSNEKFDLRKDEVWR